jgi:pantetheine-phosphate adenylyltransferase
MTCAVYLGTFDPVTLGHLDIIRRASDVFQRVVVGAFSQVQSKNPHFSIETRLGFLEEACRSLQNVEIQAFSGLAVNFAKQVGATVLVRGLRTEADFVYEMQMAGVNRSLQAGIETIFFPTLHELSFISSSLVKEVAALGGDVSGFVPPCVWKAFV